MDELGQAELSFEPSAFPTWKGFDGPSAPVTLRTATAIVDTRRALVSVLPGRITYRVAMPSEPVLTFAVGAYLTAQTEPQPIRFRLLVDAGAGEEVVFEETTVFQFRDEWLDYEVDLAKWTGQTIRLSFDSQPATDVPADPAERPLALWGNPVLTSLSWRSVEPHLVLISIDCLRASHLGVYGYERNTTPHIDALAADGVVFESAWSTSSWTLPSHVSMMTGLTPSAHGVVDR